MTDIQERAEKLVEDIGTEAYNEGYSDGKKDGITEGRKNGEHTGYKRGLETASAFLPTADTLGTLQMLADLKLAKYKSKWSKSSSDHIEFIEKNYDDVEQLIKYFTKR